MWSLSNRHQDLAHGVAKRLQPSPLNHGFRHGMKYGNPRQSGAGMMIRYPIAVLHLLALWADHCRTAIVTEVAEMARFGMYSGASDECDEVT